VKACVQALKDIPSVNAEIDGTDLIYKNYYHIGFAVGTDKGLEPAQARFDGRRAGAGREGARNLLARDRDDAALGRCEHMLGARERGEQLAQRTRRDAGHERQAQPRGRVLTVAMGPVQGGRGRKRYAR